MIIQTIQSQEALCKETNLICPVFVETGNTTVPIDILYPEWQFASFNGSRGNNGFDFQIRGINLGSQNNLPFNISFYADLDGDGVVSSNDIFIDEKFVAPSLISRNSFTLSGNLNLGENDLCNILAVIPPEIECNCGADFIRLEVETVTSQTLTACDGEILNLGAVSYTHLTLPTIYSV